MRVVDVIDGDTLRVATVGGSDLGRVRLLGLDAPKVGHDGGPSECFVSQATDLLASLAPAESTVTIRPDAGKPDRHRYDRLLRYVDVDPDHTARQDSSGPNTGAVDATERLLALGAAELYRKRPGAAARRGVRRRVHLRPRTAAPGSGPRARPDRAHAEQTSIEAPERGGGNSFRRSDRPAPRFSPYPK